MGSNLTTTPATDRRGVPAITAPRAAPLASTLGRAAFMADYELATFSPWMTREQANTIFRLQRFLKDSHVIVRQGKNDHATTMEGFTR